MMKDRRIYKIQNSKRKYIIGNCREEIKIYSKYILCREYRRSGKPYQTDKKEIQ